MYKVVIFDFDGVILESLDIKKNAFLKIFQDFPEHAEEIARYHLQNGGVSRYDKFEYIYTNILKIPFKKDESKKLGEIFSNIILDEMQKCPFVIGALEFLEKYSEISKLYIASGSPQNELRFIVEKRGLNKFFKGVYGIPASKTKIIKKILELEKINNKDVLFIGDAMADFEAAESSNIPFIARINNQTPDNPFIDMKLISVKDLLELDRILSRTK